jgi:hypothetical protein
MFKLPFRAGHVNGFEQRLLEVVFYLWFEFNEQIFINFQSLN